MGADGSVSGARVGAWIAVATRRRVLVLLSAIGLSPLLRLRRLLDDVLLSGQFLEGTVLGTIAIQVLVESHLLRQLLTLPLLAYLFYVATPQIYPQTGQFEQLVERDGFRIVTSAVGLCTAVIFGVASGQAFAPEATRLTMLTGLAATCLIGFVTYGAYLWLADTGDPLDQNELFEVFERFTVLDQSQYLDVLDELSGWQYAVGTLSMGLGTAAICLLPAVVVGMVGAALNTFYPLLELLVLFGVGAEVVARRSGIDGNRVPSGDRLDLEERVFDRIAVAGRNQKGMFMAIYCGIGLALSGLYFAAALPILLSSIAQLADLLSPSLFAGTDPEALWSVGLIVWFIIGLSLLPILYSLYGFYYWFKSLQRLPGAVRWWEAKWSPDPDPSLRRHPVGVSRPRGLMFAAHPMVLVVGVLVGAGDSSTGTYVLFGIAWPLTVGLAWWSIRTRHRAVQSLRTDSRAILVSIVGYSSVTIVFLAGFADPGAPIRNPLMVVVLHLILVVFYYFPEASLRSRLGTGTLSTYGDFLLLVVVVAMVGFVLQVVTGRLSPILVGVTVVMLGLLALTKYLTQVAESKME